MKQLCWRISFIGIVTLAAHLSFINGGDSYLFASGILTFQQTDLNEINHPDLFRWKWSVTSSDAKQINTNAADITPTPVPTIGIERPQHKNPIPLNQLDSSLVQRVHFEYDQDALTPEAKSGILINTAWIKMHTEYDILLEGHCDERGSNEYNIALGDRRASSVREYMIRQGIDPNRIMTRSFGEEKQLDTRQTSEAYSLNRRVEFYAVP